MTLVTTEEHWVEGKWQMRWVSHENTRKDLFLRMGTTKLVAAKLIISLVKSALKSALKSFFNLNQTDRVTDQKLVKDL